MSAARTEGRPGSRGAVKLGVVGATVTFASLALLSAFVFPPFLSADEIDHLDYAWRVGHGELPQFSDGVTLPADGPRHGTQFASQHPPLFYVVLAPVVTPLLDRGHWRVAVLVGRSMVILIGILVVLATAWATSWLTARRDPRLIVGTTMTLAVLTSFVTTSSAIYNDVLALLMAVLALGLAVRTIRMGARAWTVLSLAAVLAAGTATRAAFIALAVVVVPLVAFSRGPGNRRRITMKDARSIAGRLGMLIGLPALVTGWFYARNVRLTGNWTGSQTDFGVKVLGRHRRALEDVVTDLDIWRRGFGGLFAQPATRDDTSAMWKVVPTIVLLCVTVLAVVCAVRSLRRTRVTSPDVLVAIMLTATVAGVTAMFFGYVSQGGGWNSRYLFPALLPLCLGAAYGLRGPRWGRGALLVCFSVVGSILFLDQSARLLRYRTFAPTDSAWRVWHEGAELNGLPGMVVPGLLITALVGIILVATALWQLTSPSDDGEGVVQSRAGLLPGQIPPA